MTAPEQVRWDLSELFEGPEDPALAAEMDALDAEAKAIDADLRGQVARLDSPALRYREAACWRMVPSLRPRRRAISLWLRPLSNSMAVCLSASVSPHSTNSASIFWPNPAT